MLFGSKTEGDVLKNLNVSFVSSLVPRALAQALIYGVMLAYTFNLLVNFVLKVGLVPVGSPMTVHTLAGLQVDACRPSKGLWCPRYPSNLYFYSRAKPSGVCL